MPWSHVPVPTHYQIDNWEFIKQFYFAIRERYRAIGQCLWPRPNQQHEKGTVPAGITATSFTDSSKSGIWSTTDTCPPWVGTHCTDSYQGPIDWCLIIDDDDPKKAVKAHITSWTIGGVLNFDNITDFVTSKRIPSLASLVGKTYYIIGTENNSLWWSDRIMEWVNDYEFTAGTTVQYDIDKLNPTIFPASPTHSIIRDDTSHWVPKEHVGRDLLVYADDGFLKRVKITANTSNILAFATQTWTPNVGSPYSVVDAGGICVPGRGPTYIGAWYRGFREYYSSHNWDDTIGSASMPASFLCVTGHEAGSSECGCRNELMMDHDYWTGDSAGIVDDDDFTCGRAYDKCYTPDYFKTIRALQKAIEEVSYFYVEGSVSGGGLPYLGGADLFRIAGINSYTGTTGDVNGAVGDDGHQDNQIAVSGVSLPYYPCRVHFSIHRSNGVRFQGKGLMTNSSTLLGEYITETGYSAPWVFTQNNHHDNGDGTFTDTPGDSNTAIIISPGWTAYIPKEFRTMFANDGVFIGDVVAGVDGDPPNAVDASVVDWDDGSGSFSCYGIGKYVKRAVSTGYIDRRRQVNDSTATQGFQDEDSTNTWNRFQNGDYARFIGDNFHGPCITTGGNNYIGPSGDPDERYYDRYFVGKTKGNNQLEGVADDGDTFYVTDKSKNWWNYEYFDGTMRTEEGIATGGSSTTLTDAAKIDAHPDTPTVEGNCFWHTSRFLGFAGPYVGFTVEILIDGDWDDPDAFIVKRLITSGNNTTMTIGWTQPLPNGVTSGGLRYRIFEPYAINRYKDRMIVLTNPANISFTAPIIGMDDNTIFFTPIAGMIVTKGWTYKIIDYPCGGVWKWVVTNSVGKWTTPSGADANRIGVPHNALQNFHTNQTENSATYVKRFGLFTMGDYIGYEIFNELYAAINALQKTVVFGEWTAMSSDSDTSPANNSVSAGTGSGYFADCFDCTDPTNVTVYTSGDDCIYGAYCTGGDITADYGRNPSMVAVISAAWAGGGSVSSGPPQSNSNLQINVPIGGAQPDGCALSASATACYYVINAPACGLSHTTTFYSYGQIDAIDSTPIVGGPYVDIFSNPACAESLQFACASGDVSYHAWTSWSTGGGTGGNEYSSLLGSTSIPELPAITLCPRYDGAPDCIPPMYGFGSGGYYVSNAVAILTWSFEYHA